MKTKIINIQKSDSLDDVSSIIRSTEASEVILIFPKGSIFSKEASYFESLKSEADVNQKILSVMSSDPIITHLAKSLGITLLQSTPSTITKTKKKNIPEHYDIPTAYATDITYAD